MNNIYQVSHDEIIRQVLKHMQDLGISPLGDIKLKTDTSTIQRYTIEGDRRGSDNGFYRIFSDGVPSWVIGSWKFGIKETGSFNSDELSLADREAYNARISNHEYMSECERKRKQLEEEERQRKEQAMKEAFKEYNTAPIADNSHKYLTQKNKKARQDFHENANGELLIPLYDAGTGEFRTYQKIDAEGNKRYRFGTSPTGACYTYKSKNPDNVHIICEGITTGQTVYYLGDERHRVTCTTSCGNFRPVIERLRKRYPDDIFIIAADNDIETERERGFNPGKREAKRILNLGLVSGVIIPEFQKGEIGSDWEDYDFLNGRTETMNEFTRQINSIMGYITSEWQPPLNGYDYVNSGIFARDLEEFRKLPEIKTGFENLDEEQESLYPGLYVIGGTPSFGKTSFSVQIADNIAKTGNVVLFFALEQNRLELTTKSISRLTAENDRTKNRSLSTTSMNIRRGKFFTYAQEEAYKRALEDYKGYADRIVIIELGLDATISVIQETVRKFINFTGLKPVVFIDYLQIIRAENEKQATKDFVDNHVRILKKLQSENELVMIVISSFNRTNYTSPVDYESFKETGSIEYTADVLWGMQPQIMASENVYSSEEKAKQNRRKEMDKATRAIPRLLMLKNLKNRYGKKGYSCGFIYDPRFDYFIPDPKFKGNEEKGGNDDNAKPGTKRL